MTFFDDENDFRSLSLGPAEVYLGKVYRNLEWNHEKRRNTYEVYASADPEKNEVNTAWGTIIQNPLKIGGRVFPYRPGGLELWWDFDTKDFGGFTDRENRFPTFTEAEQAVLIAHLEKYFDLHGFWWELPTPEPLPLRPTPDWERELLSPRCSCGCQDEVPASWDPEDEVEW